MHNKISTTGVRPWTLSVAAVWLLAAATSLSPLHGADMTTLYMIGDSTMANKSPDNGNPEHGWGQLLPEFFKPGAVAVDNRAKDGRSTKSFRGEGLWDPVLKALRPGEWVVIQFGHNDQKKDKPHFYAEAATAYRGRGVWRSCLRGIWRGRSLGCRSIWRKAG